MPHEMQRFTQRARRVLSLAQDDAEGLHYNYIGTEHVLMGLILEKDGIAFHALDALGVADEFMVRISLRKFVRTPGGARINGHLDLNSECKELLKDAVDSAREMNNHFIGTEHLLLGIVRNEKCIACRTIYDLNLTPDQVRQAVYEIVQYTPVAPEHFSTYVIDPQIETLYRPTLRIVFETARQRAAQIRSKQLEPEHLLLGLIDSDDPDTLAFFTELGMNKTQAIDAVLAAVKGAPKRKEDSQDSVLVYSHPTHAVMLNIGKMIPQLADDVVPKDLLLALVLQEWILVRLWSMLNLENSHLKGALIRAGIIKAPPPRLSFKEQINNLVTSFRAFLRSSNNQ